jgi:hypothetical protein
VEADASKVLAEKLREEWKRLWLERIDDKVRAEGVAGDDFSMLFVERGTVIFATRDFRQLSFREILLLHKLVDVDRLLRPDPAVGGWGKFIRTSVTSQRLSIRAKEVRQALNEGKQKQQLKKGGRGWLHV